MRNGNFPILKRARQSLIRVGKSQLYWSGVAWSLLLSELLSPWYQAAPLMPYGKSGAIMPVVEHAHVVVRNRIGPRRERGHCGREVLDGGQRGPAGPRLAPRAVQLPRR